jgi:hypothetical protein
MMGNEPSATAHPLANPPAQEGKRMEPDSSLDLIIEDLPRIGPE